MSTETARKYVEGLDVPYQAVFVPQSQSRNADESNPSLNWRITFGPLVTDYMQGCAHLPHYSHAFSRNMAYDSAVREACETGKSKLRKHKNAFDAAQAGSSFARAKPVPAPDLADVLYCLVLDSEVLEYSSFEDWAECMGYDTDSRKAEGIYNQCMKIALQLRQVINLDEAREAFADY